MWQAITIALLGATCAFLGIASGDISDIVVGTAVVLLGLFVADPDSPETPEG